MATAPNFIATPNNGSVNVAAANTNIDGTGTITTLLTGGTLGTRVLEIVAQCAATSAAANVNIFLSLDSGATWKLFDQFAITANTSSTTAKALRVPATYANLVLKDATQRLGCTTTIAQSTNVFALTGDL